jgi:hypothetical protein
MPRICLITFEIISLILLVLCWRYAKRTGWFMVWQLMAGVMFGWLLEWATIVQLEAYRYGDFLLKVGPLPLGVGVGWGIIIYSARLFSDASSLPFWARPVLDALLALNIDLAMDTLAIRLGMWDWGHGFEHEFFGVPYANFWAWFWVVFCFSAALRLLIRLPGWAGKWLAPFGSMILGTAGVLGTNWLIVFVLLPNGLYEISITAVFLIAFGLMLHLKPKFSIAVISPLAFLVPLVFHVYFLAAGIFTGVAFQPPALLMISIAMLLISLYLHRKPILLKAMRISRG